IADVENLAGPATPADDPIRARAGRFHRNSLQQAERFAQACRQLQEGLRSETTPEPQSRDHSIERALYAEFRHTLLHAAELADRVDDVELALSFAGEVVAVAESIDHFEGAHQIRQWLSTSTRAAMFQPMFQRFHYSKRDSKSPREHLDSCRLWRPKVEAAQPEVRKSLASNTIEMFRSIK